MNSQSSMLVIVFGILLLMSAYFSATETAFSSLNRIRLKNKANNGNKRARQTLLLSEGFDQVLITILIGNNIVNIASASIATVIFIRYYGEAGVTLSTIVTTILVLIFGEITPKSLAKESPETFAMLSTPFLKLLIVILLPLTMIFTYCKKLISKIIKFEDKQTITQEELITLIDEAEKEGGLDHKEGELIRSAIEFNDLDVEEILTPRVKVVAINKNALLEDIKNLFVMNGYSRLPVYSETIDGIIGVIHEKDFYNMLYSGKDNIESIITNIVCVAPKMKISELLRRLQHSKSHLAVVVDEYGGTMGIVTLEDIIEELVGEIWDEHDEIIEYFTKIEDHKYLIHCNADLEDLFDRFELNSSSDNYDATTVSGWVVKECGTIPNVGDEFLYENLKVTVTKTDYRRVLEIMVEMLQTDKKE